MSEIKQQKGELILLDFWAKWCSHCLNFTPIIDEIAQEYKEKLVIHKIDIEAEPDVARKYMVRSIPTIIFVKGTQVVDRHVGAMTRQELKEFIDRNIC